MQNIDHYSIEQIKRRYEDILEGIAKNNPKVNLDKIYNLQDNRAAFIEGIKVIIQDKLGNVTDRQNVPTRVTVFNTGGLMG